MKYLSNSFDQINIDEKLCLTIGNFDGIHEGHREIINNLIKQTKTSNLKSAILSFTPHPKIYFKKGLLKSLIYTVYLKLLQKLASSSRSTI